MAEATPITPKNGEYTGAASVAIAASCAIVTRFDVSRRSGRSRVYLQVADRRNGSSSGRNDLHVTHVAKLVGHCQIWPTGVQWRGSCDE